jgi:hypothetical protein
MIARSFLNEVKAQVNPDFSKISLAIWTADGLTTGKTSLYLCPNKQSVIAFTTV